MDTILRSVLKPERLEIDYRHERAQDEAPPTRTRSSSTATRSTCSACRTVTRRRSTSRWTASRASSAAASASRCRRATAARLTAGVPGIWSGPEVTVSLKLRNRAEEQIPERLIHPPQTFTPLHGGGTLMRMDVRGWRELAWWILSWGADVEVLGAEGPARLRQAQRHRCPPRCTPAERRPRAPRLLRNRAPPCCRIGRHAASRGIGRRRRGRFGFPAGVRVVIPRRCSDRSHRGARGAVSGAGVLKDRRLPSLAGSASPFPIVTGASAGAINGTMIAARAGDFREGDQELARLWPGSSPSTCSTPTPSRCRWALTSCATWRSGSVLGSTLSRALLDATRCAFSRARCRDGIADSIRNGHLYAVAIPRRATTRVARSPSCRGRRDAIWVKSRRVVLPVRLTVEHVCASAAIPIVFPPVALPSAVGDVYFGDGALRPGDAVQPRDPPRRDARVRHRHPLAARHGLAVAGGARRRRRARRSTRRAC